MWNPFERKTKVKSASTLTPEQSRYMNQMIGLGGQYLGSTYGVLSNLGTQGYQPISDQYFQDAIANPYLAQRDQQWQDIQGRASLGGKLHSGALARQQALFGADTARTLSEQRAKLYEQERQMGEAAKSRQIQALAQLSGLLGTPLGVRAKENAMIQNPSAFDYLTQAVSGVKAVGSLFG